MREALPVASAALTLEWVAKDVRDTAGLDGEQTSAEFDRLASDDDRKRLRCSLLVLNPSSWIESLPERESKPIRSQSPVQQSMKGLVFVGAETVVTGTVTRAPVVASCKSIHL